MEMKYKVILMEKVEEFIHGLIPKLEAKALRAIQLLRECGYELREPHAKTLKNAEGLKELRAQAGNDICRLFFFHFKGVVYVITSGYVKKQQKTDKREINRALRLMHEFLEEYGDYEADKL
jgi:phage-related protein